MSRIIKKYKGEIERYCRDNNLSADKVFSSSGTETDRWVFLQHFDPEKGKLGLLDETPADVVLKIFIESSKLRFEQTEHTHMLREYEPAAQMAYAGV